MHRIHPRPRRGHVRNISLAACLLLAGCGIGPRTVPHDRFDYTEALSSSWKQQTLVNIVKLRYGDAPVFLDVASVINQYSIETSADLRWTLVPNASDAQSTGGAVRYTDKPTITYTPLAGERFARSLMKPLPPTSILSLVQAGYPIDLVFRACVHSVNGVRNHYGGAARARNADPEFYPLLARLRRLQDSGTIGLRVTKTTEMEGVLLAFRARSDQALDQDAAWVRKTLGLSADSGEFQIAYGSIAKDDKEIAILSRSVLEIIIDTGSFIDVPPEHVREQRVNPTMPLENFDDRPVLPFIRISSSKSKPADAFVTVPYRDHWYWIDDRDLRSKAGFTFLMFIFSLTETGGKEGAPIVTIPAG